MLDSLATFHRTVLSPKQCLLCANKGVPLKTKPFTAQLSEFFSRILDTSDWPPRWHCGNWSDFHGWLYICSDLVIGVAYFAIPFLLIRMLKGRPDIPFPKIIWLFIAFIIFCGTTHFMDALIFWWPAYRLSALIRLLTGVISAITLFALYRILPMVFSLRTVEELEREISQRKMAEQALTESHDQLRSFTQILSHNIRTYAGNISSLTEMIDRGTLDQENAKLVGMLSTVSASLNTTLNDLYAVMSVRDRKVPREVLSFREVYNQVAGVLETEIREYNVGIFTNFKVETVAFPKLYLESVLLNLISNSIKYRIKGEDCFIKLRTYKDKAGKTVLECADNGMGIDLSLYGDKVFGLYHTFHQNDTAHGIGLFLIKTQLESQGASIHIESEPGKGATFIIVF
ncbi:HAMP domain-containing histidine kinase [Mucilaginibacter corticis]|uniref:histidine kinase n=1 Tax=Mucilaginibacter corticis TaxID=2597670 RepID=A0A556MMB0_9SPHI|nr:HAMP domain-containing sensor histidine kinase [Mucilaginibacter corticis]TSJ41071.1 HAMP domain-containing histidine kinase [Mucilaginibacter corticis]